MKKKTLSRKKVIVECLQTAKNDGGTTQLLISLFFNNSEFIISIRE